MKMWTYESVKDILSEIEKIASKHNLHIALGGSVMYKGESDHDLDIIVYPHNYNSPMLHNFISETKNIIPDLHQMISGSYIINTRTVYTGNTIENKRIDLLILI